MYFPDNMTFQYFFFNTYPGYFLQALPFALIAGLVFVLYRSRRERHLSPAKRFLPALFVCYLTGLLCLTLFLYVMGDLYYFLFYHAPSGRHIRWFCLEFDLIPTLSPDAEQLGNFLMFLPFGILYPLFQPRSGLKGTITAGLVTCLGIELLQPVFGRSFDINDIILNGLAVVLSACVFYCLRAVLTQRRK